MNKKIFEKLTVDRVLKMLCVFSFALVALAQIGLKIPSLKGMFTNIEVFEGRAVENGENAVISGFVTLEMIKGEPDADIEILVNGEKAEAFDEKIKKIELFTTSVIEIKSNKKASCTVRISKISDSLLLSTAKSDITVLNGINFVGRIILKND